MVKKGIPKEVLRELDIRSSEEVETDFEVTAIVERHQVKLPIPSKVRRELELKRGKKLNVKYDPKKGTLTYKL